MLVVTAGGVDDTRAFELVPDRQVFEEVPLLLAGAPIASEPVAKGLASP